MTIGTRRIHNARPTPAAHRAIAWIWLSSLALVACGGKPPQGGPPPTPVNVAEVVAKDVTEWDEFTGRIEAIESVEIRPRVTGYLQKVDFREGSEVKKGDVLFEIDDREFAAAVRQSDAALARARAQAEEARAEAARTDSMVVRKLISVEDQQKRVTALTTTQADVHAAEAALTQARLNLEFTRVTAPIDGRVSRANVTPGNLVTSGMPQSTLLTTIVSQGRVYVYFNGDEQVYLKYQRMDRAGERPSSRVTANPVRMGLANEDGFPHEGHMDFVDNQLDPNTGTIRGRAVFEDPDGMFTPGMFARLQLLGSGSYKALLIHDRAVLTDQDRKYVFVLGPKNEALRKDVKLGPQVDGLRVVTTGLQPGDKVVVNGVAKIFFPGMPVQPNVVPMDKPDRAPPSAGPDAAHTSAH